MKKWWVGVLTLVLCLSAYAQTAEETEPTASVPSMPPLTPEITEAPQGASRIFRSHHGLL